MGPDELKDGPINEHEVFSKIQNKVKNNIIKKSFRAANSNLLN